MRRLEEIEKEITALKDEAADIKLKEAQDAFLHTFKQVAQKVDDGDLKGAAEIAHKQLSTKAGGVMKSIDPERERRRNVTWT